MPSDEQTLITSTEAARRLALSMYTVARLARTGALPYARKLPGGKGAYLFDPDVIDAYARERLAEHRSAIDALEKGLSPPVS